MTTVVALAEIVSPSPKAATEKRESKREFDIRSPIQTVNSDFRPNNEHNGVIVDSNYTGVRLAQ
jgi:hypothetical protein